MESPPVTLELLRTVGRKLKSSLASPKALSPGMPPIQSGLSQIPSDLQIDILHLLTPQEPSTEWKKSIAMLRQKGPCKPFIENKAPAKGLENAIRQRKAYDTTKFTIEQSTPAALSLPTLRPSLLIRLKGSLTPNDYITAEKKSLAAAAATINSSIDREVKKTVEIFEERSLNPSRELKTGKTPASRLLAKLPENNTSIDENIPKKVIRESAKEFLPYRNIATGSAKPIIGSVKSVITNNALNDGHKFSAVPNKAYTIATDLAGLDLEEYPNNKDLYTGSFFTKRPANEFVNCETIVNNTMAQKRDLYGSLSQPTDLLDKMQVYNELTMSEIITKRELPVVEKKRETQGDVTGLDSFVSWRRKNKEREGATVVTEALKIDDTSIKFFPTMLSELTANYSKDLADNINKTC